MARRVYSAEFRRRVIDLVEAGRPVAGVAAELGISGRTVSMWRRRARIDARIETGMTTAEHAELAACANGSASSGPSWRSIVGRLRWAGGRRTKSRFAAIEVMAAEGLPVERACGLLGVSVSGCCGWLRRSPLARSVCHGRLSDVIAVVHAGSPQTYGAVGVHAEPAMGRGIAVCRQTVETLMRRAGLGASRGGPSTARSPTWRPRRISWTVTSPEPSPTGCG